MTKSTVSPAHSAANSPEQVAHRLLHHVADVEGKKLYQSSETETVADRKYILDTFAECLDAVRGNRNYTRA